MDITNRAGTRAIACLECAATSCEHVELTAGQAQKLARNDAAATHPPYCMCELCNRTNGALAA